MNHEVQAKSVRILGNDGTPRCRIPGRRFRGARLGPGSSRVHARARLPSLLPHPPGAWKVLSVPALLAPRLPRLKEWAYAGIFFDLTGAAASHAFSGDPPGRIATPLLLLLIAAMSWALRPSSRTWKSDSTLPDSAQAV